MNHTPTMTIKPSMNIPTFPLRLSWRITHIRNPVKGIKKIKKKIILEAFINYTVNLVLNICKAAMKMIKTAIWPSVKYPVQQNHYSETYDNRQLLSSQHYPYNIQTWGYKYPSLILPQSLSMLP